MMCEEDENLKKIFYCVVPENIHTPTKEGIGNSRGVGGSKSQEIPEGMGVRGEIFIQRVGSRSTFFVCQLAPLTYFSGTF